MNGLMNASVSAGSSHLGASVTWMPQVSVPSGAAAAGAGAMSEASTSKTRAGSMGRRMTPPGPAASDRDAGYFGERRAGPLVVQSTHGSVESSSRQAGAVSYTHLRAHETGRNL